MSSAIMFCLEIIIYQLSFNNFFNAAQSKDLVERKVLTFCVMLYIKVSVLQCYTDKYHFKRVAVHFTVTYWHRYCKSVSVSVL